MEQPVILISEGYSPKNLGDGELVAASIDFAITRLHGRILSILAHDVGGVATLWPDFAVQPRLFSRAAYSERRAVARVLLVLQWMYFLLMQTAVCLTPTNFRGGLAVWVARSGPRNLRRTANLYLECTHVVPVGGGYIGDKYVRESFLTLWTWWWSTRLGKTVVTMPMSIEASTTRLRFAVRSLLRSVPIAARDTATVEVLSSLNIANNAVPDLAFRNFRGALDSTTAAEKNIVVIVPVGSDYYSPQVWREQLFAVLQAVASLPGDPDLAVYCMHQPLPDQTRAGFDREAAEYLMENSRSPVIDLQQTITSYESLVSYFRDNARLVVTARMHAGIAALCADTPLAMLGYELKHESLMSELHLLEQFGHFGATKDSQLAVMFQSALTKEPGVVAERVGELHRRLDLWGGKR